MENIDQLQDRPSGIALCPKEDCLPPGISQYADVASEPRQQLPPPGDIDQPTNTRTFQHDRGARCVCHRSLQVRYPPGLQGLPPSIETTRLWNIRSYLTTAL